MGFREDLARLNFSCAEEAVKLYETLEREDIKQKCLEMIVSYSHPKLKPVDEKGQANDENLASSLLTQIPPEVLVEAYRINAARKKTNAST